MDSSNYAETLSSPNKSYSGIKNFFDVEDNSFGKFSRHSNYILEEVRVSLIQINGKISKKITTKINDPDQGSFTSISIASLSAENIQAIGRT
jgi:hypothetical protein